MGKLWLSTESILMIEGLAVKIRTPSVPMLEVSSDKTVNPKLLPVGAIHWVLPGCVNG